METKNLSQALLELGTCGMNSVAKSKLRMAILTEFLDDSGSEGKSHGPAFVLAGYVASFDAWDQFSKEWDAVLKDEHPIEYFKMREANSLKGQFFGWSPEEKDAKVDRLALVILRHVEFGITNSIFWDDLETVVNEFPDIPLHPYDLLLHGSMAKTVGYVRKNYPVDSIVGFTLDEQGKWGTRAARAYDFIKQFLTSEEQRAILGRPEHKDDKVFYPLQAADMIAWHARRFCSDNAHVPPDAPPDQFTINCPALKRLQEVRTIYNTYGVDRLRSIARSWRVVRLLHPQPPDSEAEADTIRKWYKSKD